jgi:hypothetical protein
VEIRRLPGTKRLRRAQRQPAFVSLEIVSQLPFSDPVYFLVIMALS